MRFELLLLGLALAGSACAKKNAAASVADEPAMPVQEVALAPGQSAGAIAKDKVSAVIREQMPTIRQCYETPLAKDASLAGRVAIRFMIAEDGSVSAAQVSKDEVPDPVVSRCVLKTFRQMQFPEPTGGVVIVTYPFLFASE
ncbi:MAG: TonB family protein [Myxococcota bacterium]